MEIETQAAPVDGGGQEPIVENSAPVESQEQQQPLSAREAVEAAFKEESAREYNRHPDGKFAPSDDKAQKQEKPAKPDAQAQEQAAPVEAKPDAPPVPPVDQPVTGQKIEPPARFSADAKAVWDKAPDPVKHEISRAISELENGIQQKTQQLQQYSTVEPYRQMAAERGKDLGNVLQAYVAAEQQLMQNPVAGLTDLMQRFNVNPVQYAQYILSNAGIGVDETQSGANAVYQQQIATQNQQVASLSQEIQSLKAILEQQEQARLSQEIESFAKDRPGFNELRPLMGQLIASNMAQGITDAYEMASRLRPELTQSQAPVQAAQPAQIAQPLTAQAPAPVQTPAPQAPQTRKPNLQISGAPTGGSNPTSSKPPPTARDAVKAAFAALS